MTGFSRKACLLCRVLEFVAAYLLPVLSHLSSNAVINQVPKETRVDALGFMLAEMFTVYVTIQLVTAIIVQF